MHLLFAPSSRGEDSAISLFNIIRSLGRLTRRCLLGGAVFAFSVSAIQAQPAVTTDSTPLVSPDLLSPRPLLPSDTGAKRLWIASVVSLSVANVLDVQSSLGKHELNSALAGPSGTLGTQGILLKAALQGGLLGAEYLVTRAYSRNRLGERPRSKLYRSLAIINFAGTAVFAGVAAHNYTVPRTRP
jgi:hypothetical protein